MAPDDAGIVRGRSTADAATADTDRGAKAPGPEPDSGRALHDELPLDVIFELLKNQRRRRVLRYLEEESGTVDLGTLAEALAAKENDTSPRALSSSERKRVYIGLYQCHLPKLDDADIIEFDSDRGTITRTARTLDLQAYLDRLRLLDEADSDADTDADGWPTWQFGLTLAGGGMYLFLAAFLPSALLSFSLVGLIVVGLLGTSVAHLLDV